MKWLSLSLTILLTAAANLLLKAASMQGSLRGGDPARDFLAAIKNPAYIIGALCLGVALIPYAIALRKIDLSVAYPIMTASVMLLVSLFAIVLFRESFTTIKLIGMVAILCGVALLSVK